MLFERQSFLVAGISRSGIASAQYLRAKGATVYLYDDVEDENVQKAVRSLEEIGCNAVKKEELENKAAFADVLVLSPGIPVDHPLPVAFRRAGKRILGETELAALAIRCPLIAVTGTNGKTTTVTMAEGSPAANVLPQTASVTVNFRMMPGTTIQNVEEHIRACVRNKAIGVEYLKGKEASKISPTDSRSFQILETLCTRTNPDMLVAPYLVMGGTDAYHYEEVCDCIYRFSPFVMDTALLLTTHGTNERLPIACMGDALRFFKRYIRMMSAE